MKVEADAPPIKEITDKLMSENSPRGMHSKDKVDSNTVPMYSGEKYN
jgi:hypothetical protein